MTRPLRELRRGQAPVHIPYDGLQFREVGNVVRKTRPRCRRDEAHPLVRFRQRLFQGAPERGFRAEVGEELAEAVASEEVLGRIR